MQSRVQNITTVRYLLDLLHSDVTHKKTELDVNVFLYVVVLFFGGVI